MLHSRSGFKPLFRPERKKKNKCEGLKLFQLEKILQSARLSFEMAHFDPKHSRPNAAAWTSGCVPERRLRLWSAGIGGGGVFGPQLHAEAGGTLLASGHMFKPLKIRRPTFLASGCQYIETIAYRNKPTVIATLMIAFWLVSEHFQKLTRPSTRGLWLSVIRHYLKNSASNLTHSLFTVEERSNTTEYQLQWAESRMASKEDEEPIQTNYWVKIHRFKFLGIISNWYGTFLVHT